METKSRIFSAAVVLLAITELSDAKMSDASYFYNKERPLVIGHRGSFGAFPEESMPSFTNAYYGGADFLEMDLQVTRDNVLICQHDSNLDTTTNIAEYADQFADRRHKLDRKFYVEDFDLDELRLLKRKQRYEWRSPMLNDKFEIVTLQEVIDNVKMLNQDAPRVNNADTPAGLYIELKDYSSILKKRGLNTAEMMNEVLTKNGLSTIAEATASQIPIVVQSFDFEALEKYAELSDLPLVQLAHIPDTYDWAAISKVVHGVGPDSHMVINSEGTYSSFVTEMHGMDLAVHPFTLQDDNLKYMDTPYDEAQLYVDSGVDGVFCEFPHGKYVMF